MVLQRVGSQSVEEALPLASNHEKRHLVFDWFPVQTRKSGSSSELFDDTSSSFGVPEFNLIRRGRKLKRKANAIGLLDQETDEALMDDFQDGPSCSNFRDGNDAGTSASIDLPEYTSSRPRLWSASPVEGIRSASISPEKSKGEVHPRMNESEVCPMTDFLDSELEIDDDRSIRGICISLLKDNGLLAGDWSKYSNALMEVGQTLEEGSFLQNCELCSTQDDTRKMLLCDQCDKAFHVSCCNSKTKTLPEDEWFCQSCSKSNAKASSENFFLKSCTPRCWNGVPGYKLGPIARMLKDPEPYVSRVRIGERYQAEVPQWSSQIANDIDCIGKPLEVRPEETMNFHGSFKDKFSKGDSASNWLQCQKVMDDDERSGQATICGKWRRAPISEVQKDDWECSSAVIWDPIHSDCAVPQELETDQVLPQLKYIGRLQARLAARRP